MTVDTVIGNFEHKWWKEATVYQIWPASYKDSNDDGVGDLQGIISKLDYIKDLGVDVIWLSPMYDSPQEDMGYDISNYEAIYPKYGTMEDMDNLIKGVHDRGMKILVDLVINHCSAEHEWFKESRSSKDNPKRDWFWWRPAKYDSEGNRHPPNNWASHFGGSAWTWDEHTQEYYLRLFAERQPDFNWENDETRKLIYDTAILFWLKKGVDGFRIDTAGLYSKVPGLPDLPVADPKSEFQDPNPCTHNGPRIHEFIKEMNRDCFSKYDIMTVGEVGRGDISDILKFAGASLHEIDEMFIFDITNLGTSPIFKYDLTSFDLVDFKKAVVNCFKFVETSDAWSTVYLENHDQPRSITRFGDESSVENWDHSGKLLATMLATLTGTLYIYQGQEFGMTNFKNWTIDQYEDVDALNNYKIVQAKKDPELVKRFMDGLLLVSRDHARTPVQWDSSEHAGFSLVKPWFGVNENYKQINAESQLHSENSILSYYKKVLRLRKEHKDLFVYGTDFVIHDEQDLKLFLYSKKTQDGSKQLYAVLNFSSEELKFRKPLEGKYEFVISNYETEGDEEDTLRPWESRLYIVT